MRSQQTQNSNTICSHAGTEAAMSVARVVQGSSSSSPHTACSVGPCSCCQLQSWEGCPSALCLLRSASLHLCQEGQDREAAWGEQAIAGEMCHLPLCLFHLVAFLFHKRERKMREGGGKERPWPWEHVSEGTF